MQRSTDWICTQTHWKLCWYGMYNPRMQYKNTRFWHLKMFLLQPGPKVSLSPSVVDFGCVEEGEARVRRVELINSSPAEAVYQWDLDCDGHSVFNIHPACGIVRPHSQTSLKAVYRPTGATAHHRRVPCLILHKVVIIRRFTAHVFKSLQQLHNPLPP